MPRLWCSSLSQPGCSGPSFAALLNPSWAEGRAAACSDKYFTLAAADGTGVPALPSAHRTGLLPDGTSLPCPPLPVSIPVSSVQCYYIIYSFELEDDVCSVLYEFFIKIEKQPNLVSFESW